MDYEDEQIMVFWATEPRASDPDILLDGMIDAYTASGSVDVERRRSTNVSRFTVKYQRVTVSSSGEDTDFIVGVWYNDDQNRAYFVHLFSTKRTARETFLRCVESFTFY